MWLFDTQILVFRTSTLLFIIAVFAVFLLIMRTPIRRQTLLGVQMEKRLGLARAVDALAFTVFSFIAMELSWEVASELRWSLITPIPQWITLQSQPVMFLTYFSVMLLAVPFVIISVKNQDIGKKEVYVPLIAVFCYYIVANLVSPSIYFNDYGYAIRYSGEALTEAQKVLFLIPEYFAPRLLFVGALLVTPRARVTYSYSRKRGD